VVQADFVNEQNIGTVIMLAMSTGAHGDDGFHVAYEPSSLNGLTKAGVIKCEQILTLSTDRLDNYSGVIEPRYLERAEKAIRMILELH
jgi:mRNA-degrading endonuclease toxin of MazEF toxin-antitoxin module